MMKKNNRLHNLILATCLSLSSAAGGAFAQAYPERISVTVNTAGETTPFPHFWEHMFGSGRANLSMRESYRDDLRKVRSVVDVQYIRAHGIYMDENGVYEEDKDGKPIYNWTYVDQIYDGYLANGVKPFVELSFMPKKLAAKEAIFGFWYHPNVAPPKDWHRWGELNFQLAQHLISRYGIDEVSKWYFEVWNEPNIGFWESEPKESTYYKLYDFAAKGLKRADSRLRVAARQLRRAAWVDRFIDHCVKESIPVDFVSTHVYANDSAQDVFGTNEVIPRSTMVARAMKKVHDQVKASQKPDLPIIWSEFNASYANEQAVTDSAYMGPWLANLIRQADGLANEVSYWTFSDVFEEQGVASTPFYGGFGLITPGSIPKTAFNTFKLLHLLGDQRLQVDSDVMLATKRGDGTIVTAVWNYFAPEESGRAKTVNVKLNGCKPNATAQIYVLDAQHGCALTKWKELGSPTTPTREQQKALREAGALPPPAIRNLDDSSSISLELQPHALALVIVPHNPAF